MLEYNSIKKRYFIDQKQKLKLTNNKKYEIKVTNNKKINTNKLTDKLLLSYCLTS